MYKHCLKKSLRLALLGGLLGLSVLTAACGSTAQSAEPAQQTAQTEADKKEAPKAEPKKEQNGPKVDTSKVCVADDGFTNLQLQDAKTPVYDKYTIAQRRELGLTTETPELQPYKNGKIAYLTFDDGPDPVNTVAILDILKAEGIPATFYVQGQHVEGYPDIIKRIYQENHALANHSYDHDYDDIYASRENFLAQMQRTDEAIHKLLGLRPLNLRAPGGTFDSFDEAFWNNLRKYSYTEHDWNVCCDDAVPVFHYAPELVQCVERDLASNPESAIVLMHSTGAKTETVKALPEIISVLRERGYSFGVVTPMTPQPW